MCIKLCFIQYVTEIAVVIRTYATDKEAKISIPQVSIYPFENYSVKILPTILSKTPSSFMLHQHTQCEDCWCVDGA